MKTAISIPDSIFQAAESMAHHLKISRSELFTTAVSEFMDTHKNDDVTTSLNKVYKNTNSKLDPELSLMQNSSIEQEKW